ncbi:MAG: extracellular solute-binding protein, partial [Acidobacteria bacterium]|nr:extracellular solute-binding protein [Acidobacteriota bacterium]
AGPDIVVTPGPSFAFELVQAGQLLPLDDYVQQLGWSDRFVPWALNLGKVDGKLYSIPNELETLVLYYNKTLFEEKGSAEGIRIVNQGAKPFLDGELYLFVIDDSGSIAAHAFDQSRVGIAANELYDHEGQPYGKLMLKLANEKGVWIPYLQFNPVSKKVEPKQSFVRKANGYIFGCGVYGE